MQGFQGQAAGHSFRKHSVNLSAGRTVVETGVTTVLLLAGHVF